MRARQIRRTLAAASSAVLCMALLPAATAQAAPKVPTAGTGRGEHVGNYDSRSDGPARKVLAARAATLNANPTNGVKTLRQQLGTQGIVDLDALTATPRRVTRIDGFLTAPSRKPAATVAKDYLRSHTDVFGLNA